MEREEAIKKAMEDCGKNGRLKDFFGKYSTEEIVDMMMAEMCRNDIIEHLQSDGSEEGMISAARSAFLMGLPAETIHDITGLDIDVIQNQN